VLKKTHFPPPREGVFLEFLTHFKQAYHQSYISGSYTYLLV
jgi:hypothetical protein